MDTAIEILTICMYCKKRKSRPEWIQQEVPKDFPKDQISHGICPDCAKAHFPKYFPDKD